MSEQRLRAGIAESIELKQRILADDQLMSLSMEIAEVCITALKNDGKVLFCGNGGSAADAQHLAGELSGRFYYDRPPLFSEALHVNGAYLTAVANDYGYDEVFARMTRAMGRAGDVLIGLSTSGNSPNVVAAIQAANEIGMKTVGFTGETGGKLAKHCHYLLPIPARDTPRIQECHMLLGHLICEIIEARMFPR